MCGVSMRGGKGKGGCMAPWLDLRGGVKLKGRDGAGGWRKVDKPPCCMHRDMQTSSAWPMHPAFCSSAAGCWSGCPALHLSIDFGGQVAKASLAPLVMSLAVSKQYTCTEQDSQPSLCRF